MRVSYVVSRFPLASETFILRELNALDRSVEIELDLLALFPADRPFVHPEARPWLDRVQRVSPARAAGSLLWWTARRPLTVLRCAAELIRSYRRRPSLLARALLTLAIASAHAHAVRTRGTEHVHAHFATYPAITAWVVGRLTGVPYSITAHAHDIFVDQSHLGVLVREAAFVVAISEFNRAFLAPYGAGGAGETPVHVVRCGVDPQAYPFRPRTIPPEGPVRALCVASLEEYKGHRVLLEALARGEGLDRVHLTLVGAGSLEPDLRERVSRLGLDGRVDFLGARSEPEVAELLEQTDVFVLPSIVARDGQMEGIPVALMEALACGVPVLASNLSGIPELVRDGVTGVLAEPADPDSLARGLARVLSDAELTRERSVQGRALVEREFDVQRSADALRGLFLAASPGGPKSSPGSPRSRPGGPESRSSSGSAVAVSEP